MTPSCYPAEVAIETLAPKPTGSTPEAGPIVASWLGRMDYGEALALQKRLVNERAGGRIGDQLLLLEHPRVLTLGRTADPAHIRADPALLAAQGIEVVRVERGGEVTYHGPGQLVTTCAAYGVAAGRRDGHPGCWCDPGGSDPRKIGALGLRIERGVSYHGIALNVTVDLADFALIDPCGMPGVTSTSIANERGETTSRPITRSVEHAAAIFAGAFAAELGAPLTGI